MSKAIFKYPLDLNDLQDDSSIPKQMPVGSSPLYATKQKGGIILYVEVDPDANLTERKVYVFGTGQPLTCTSRAEPMGVIHGYDDEIMLHVYVEQEGV